MVKQALNTLGYYNCQFFQIDVDLQFDKNLERITSEFLKLIFTKSVTVSFVRLLQK